MPTLLHVCCAPCSISCIETLRSEGVAATGFWYNPNIHPFTEYRARRDALVGYAAAIDLPLLVEDCYGLRDFVRAVAGDMDGRCGYCYTCRLEATAHRAAEGGFDAFTTTLLVSPYQNRDRLLEAGAAAAARYGVSFLPYDFRPGFRAGQAKAREAGLYMQKYCGCVFSEEERYCRKKR